METAIVTGAGGFLGLHVVREFLRHGWHVAGVDRLLSPPLGMERTADFEYHTIDLPSSGFDGLIKRLKPAAIIHTAGPASVGQSMEQPVSDFAGSAYVLSAILDAIRRHDSDAKIIFFSSAAVYGNPPSLPIDESAPLAPISPYGYHKMICENLLEEYHKIYGVRSCAVRIFSAYGRELRRQVMWDICRMAMTDGAIKLSGTGKETRDFIHASDIAAAARLLIEKGKFAAEAYNLAGGQRVSMESLAKMLVHGLGVTVPVEFSGQSRAGDPANWQASIAKISAMGFAPTISLDGGASDYAIWARHCLNY